MIFINTRPIHQATALSAYLNSSHTKQILTTPLQVIDMPLLNITPITPNQASLGKLNRLGEYRILIIISVNAWQCAKPFVDIANLASLSQQNLAVVAVGKTTAHALSAHAIHCQTPASASNEAMLAMPIIQNLKQNDQVMIWRGIGGRTLLCDTLQACNIKVDGIAFYERTKPNLPSQTVWQQHLNQSTPNKTIVLITSEQAFLHWHAHSQKWAKQSYYIALGTRLTHIIQNKLPNIAKTRILTVNDLAHNSILQAILTIQHNND